MCSSASVCASCASRACTAVSACCSDSVRSATVVSSEFAQHGKFSLTLVRPVKRGAEGWPDCIRNQPRMIPATVKMMTVRKVGSSGAARKPTQGSPFPSKAAPLTARIAMPSVAQALRGLPSKATHANGKKRDRQQGGACAQAKSEQDHSKCEHEPERGQEDRRLESAF